MKGHPPLPRLVEIEDGGIQDQLAPGKGPAPAFHLDATRIQQPVAQLALAHRHAGIDLRDTCRLPRRGTHVEKIVEVQPGRQPLNLPEHRRQADIGRGEAAGARHRLARPVEAAGAGNQPVHIGDHAIGERGQLVGLQPFGVESDAGDVEQGVSCPLRQIVRDGYIPHRYLALGSDDRGLRADLPVAQPQGSIRGLHRFEARLSLGVGQDEAATKQQIALLDPPIALAVRKRQRHGTDAAGERAELAAKACAEIAAELADVEPRRLIGTQAHRGIGDRKTAGGQIELRHVRRQAQRAVPHFAAKSRLQGANTAGHSLRAPADHGRTDRAQLKAIAVQHRAGCGDARETDRGAPGVHVEHLRVPAQQQRQRQPIHAAIAERAGQGHRGPHLARLAAQTESERR
eukprot:Opistho-1_new@46985